MSAALDGMWSLRSAALGRMRTASLLSARQALQARPRRARAPCAVHVRACAAAAGNGSGSGGEEHFTVTTPLYYSNAGAAGCQR